MMINKQSGAPLVHQLPVQPGPGPAVAPAGPGHMFSSWPRYAATPVLPGLAGAGFTPAPRFNGGGSPPGGHMGSKHGGAECLSRTNLYIRGLSPHTTDKDLINLCQK